MVTIKKILTPLLFFVLGIVSWQGALTYIVPAHKVATKVISQAAPAVPVIQKVHQQLPRIHKPEQYQIESMNQTPAEALTVPIATIHFKTAPQAAVENNSVNVYQWIKQHSPQQSIAPMQAGRTPAAQTIIRQPSLHSHKDLGRHYTKAERKLLDAPAASYTIQLMGTRNFDSIRSFIIANELRNKAFYYHTKHHGSNWYVLVEGQYASAHDAFNSINHMSPEMRKWKPFVKRFATVQTEIRS